MTNPPRSSLEARVYQAYWQDGSLDIAVGVAALFMGMAWLAGMVWLGAVVPAVLIPVWAAFRKRVVEPRLGEVRFQTTRRRRVRHGLLLLVVVGLAVFALAMAGWIVARQQGGSADWLRAASPALPGTLLGIGGILAALMFGLGRLAVYGGVFIAAAIGVAWQDADPAWAFLAGGVIAMVRGLWLMGRFLHAFPALPDHVD